MPAESTRYFVRFRLYHRILHIMVIVSFLGLALTGMSLKFSGQDWGVWLSWVMGGPMASRFLHRLFAVVTFLYFGLHVLWIIRSWIKDGFKKTFWGPDSIMPQFIDIKQMYQNVKYFLGKGPQPRFDKYTYWEKFDYFAVFWGVAIIGSTGLVLWFPVLFAHFLPGILINAAIIVHSDEALLAVGFIFTIHFFNTHLRPEKFPMDKVIFTGRVTEEELKNERPAEYERLIASGRLEKIETTEAKHWVYTAARIGGFTAVTIGLILVIMIVWALIAG
ncbi:MAG: cytochrome b/b6 domain-containing protein [Spirochaetota bacterium]